jgi:N-acetyltransferase
VNSLNRIVSEVELQPFMTGNHVALRPLVEADREALFMIASDPLIWEQHPNRDRHERKVFDAFFNAALASQGAHLVIDAQTGAVLGTSRYYDWNPETHSVAIGFTFLSRACWGKGHNREMKELMLRHAFTFAKTVIFHIGEHNRRSRKAIEKIGAHFLRSDARVHTDGRPNPTVVYKMNEDDFRAAFE